MARSGVVGYHWVTSLLDIPHSALSFLLSSCRLLFFGLPLFQVDVLVVDLLPLRDFFSMD